MLLCLEVCDCRLTQGLTLYQACGLEDHTPVWVLVPEFPVLAILQGLLPRTALNRRSNFQVLLFHLSTP